MKLITARDLAIELPNLLEAKCEVRCHECGRYVTRVVQLCDAAFICRGCLIDACEMVEVE
jgi:hypothetical protein